MPCPRCGYDLTSVTAAACPNCGLPLTQQPGAQQPAAQQPGYPPAGYPAAPSTPLYSQPQYQPLSEQPPQGTQPSGWPPTYGAPQGYPTNPSYPTGAPPSVPLAPGQGYGQTYYAQPGMSQPQYAPPPKRGNGLIIGIILAIVVVVGGGGAAALALSHSGTSTGSGTPTVTSTTGPTATPAETVLYQETFASQPPSGDWSQDSNCFYSDGGYHIKDGYFCFAPTGEQADVDIAVDAQQISGDTTSPYGIGFRRPGQGEHYEFDIDSAGEWVFYSCDPAGCTQIVDYTKNSAIKGGLNTTNTLRVFAKGSHFDFFVNGTKVGQADDTTYTTGDLGLVVDTGAEAVFNNMVVTRPN